MNLNLKIHHKRRLYEKAHFDFAPCHDHCLNVITIYSRGKGHDPWWSHGVRISYWRPLQGTCPSGMAPSPGCRGRPAHRADAPESLVIYCITHRVKMKGSGETCSSFCVRAGDNFFLTCFHANTYCPCLLPHHQCGIGSNYRSKTGSAV